MNILPELKYANTDEWVKVEGNVATIGISDHAQEQLSDIVFVEITVSVGDAVKKSDVIATLESVKAAADVIAPVNGVITAINEDLAQASETVNTDPYGKAWMVKIEMSDPADLTKLMDAPAYEKYCSERGH